MNKLFAGLSSFLLVMVILHPAKSVLAGSTDCVTSPLIITELQTGAFGSTGSVNYRYEFVELYNCGDTLVQLEDYEVSFKRKADSTDTIATMTLSGTLESDSFLMLTHNSYKTFLGTALPDAHLLFPGSGTLNALPADGGYVEITKNVEGVDESIGSVAYGDAAVTNLSPTPPSGRSVKRCVNEEGFFVSTSDNSKDFLVTDLPTLSFLFKPGPSCPRDSETVDEEEEEGSAYGAACEGVIISELLPNPAGADGGKEFIELHNPTDEVVSLDGCLLQTSANTKTYGLPDIELQPSEYRSFYDEVSGLTLVNAAGGTVWLLSPTTELQEVEYPGSLDDDESWSWFGYDLWSPTFSITPSATNILLADKPCPAGQERNTETGRCRNIAVETSASTCKAGQEFNPATKRCRSIASSASSSLAPCAAGQYRNPETNRCKKIDSPSVLAACAVGQERNPDTNRCRKIAASASGSGFSPVKDIESQNAQNMSSWWLAGASAATAMGYGAFEWRQEFMRLLASLKNKFTGSSPPS